MSVHQEQTIVASGRPSMARGVRHAFGFSIRPEQMLEFIHDVVPSAPVPFDAQFEMLEFDDETRIISFHYTSLANPLETCYALPVLRFFDLLKQHAEGVLPIDSELDGIEVSSQFTIILLRVKSDHFPKHPGDKLPLAHLRYEAGQLALLNVCESIQKDRRIQISDKR